MKPTLFTMLAASGALLAAPVAAEESRDALLTVLAQNACSVAQPEVVEMFGPEGFTPGFVQETLSGWLVDGTASEDARGILSVPASICPPESPAPSPRDAMIEAFSGAECRLMRSELGQLTERTGLSEAQMRAIVEPMVASGTITISRSAATLDDALCDPKT
ncbi:hypothetical protein [Profundibacterium mesophilum]|uniref:Uncharacterized protein n=1 Tax=Profundibacterium mesophilum KAUST100406-0324 TaxID=1037889 RepID=A0A921NRE4_9RHOB|nr:hypothetical protein [Profundibacterium mesophilum]KAF0674869.1 hypothetical protein PMES_02945 [Profundibacterium mesophilum KAUST100406-0324]